jgi:hypothetical protein
MIGSTAMTKQIATLTAAAIIRITTGLETMIVVLMSRPSAGPRIPQTVNAGVRTTSAGKAIIVTTITVKTALGAATEEGKDGEIRVTSVDMTIEQGVSMVPRHETEAYDTADRLVAKLMARAMTTAFEALRRTSMVLPVRGVPTASDTSTTGLTSASEALLTLRSGSANLLRRDSTNLLKGAAMRWNQRTSASETRLGVMKQTASQPKHFHFNFVHLDTSTTN